MRIFFCFSWGHLRRSDAGFGLCIFFSASTKKQQFHNWITNKPWGLNTLYNRNEYECCFRSCSDWGGLFGFTCGKGRIEVPLCRVLGVGVGILQFSSVYEWKSGFRFTLHSNQCIVSQRAGSLFSRFIFCIQPLFVYRARKVLGITLQGGSLVDSWLQFQPLYRATVLSIHFILRCSSLSKFD